MNTSSKRIFRTIFVFLILIRMLWKYLFYTPSAYVEAILFKTEVSCHPRPPSWIPSMMLSLWISLLRLSEQRTEWEGLKQKCLLSQFWRRAVRNQGVGRAVLSPKDLEENLFRTFLLAAGFRQCSAGLLGLQPPPLSHCLHLLCVSVCVFPLLIRTPVLLDRAHPKQSMTSP